MKQLLRIHQSSGMHWVGNGFPVRSVFDYNGLGRELSPFLLLDYAAPYQFAPGNEKRGVGGHAMTLPSAFSASRVGVRLRRSFGLPCQVS